MATNPIPRRSKNLSVNVPDELHAELKRLAAESSVSLSEYVRQILSLARAQNLRLKTKYIVDDDAPLLAAESRPEKR